MYLIRLINTLKNFLRLSPIYKIDLSPSEEETEELYARIRKGFYPTPEEVQQYDKYQLVMRYWILRKLAGRGPIKTFLQLRRATRRVRRAFRSFIYREKEHKRRFLKAFILLRRSNVIKHISRPSRKMFLTIYKRHRAFSLQRRTSWGYAAKFRLNQIVNRRLRRTHKLVRLLKVDPQRLAWFFTDPLQRHRKDHLDYNFIKLAYNTQVPGGAPEFLNKPHKREASALLNLAEVEDKVKQRNILSQLEVTHEVDDELYGHRKKFIVRPYHIAKEEYSFHNRRNLRWLPWGKYHRYRIANYYLTRGLSHKLFLALKKKSPSFQSKISC